MIQFISHYTEQYSYIDSIRMALDGGCRWIQLRMKGAAIDDVRTVALEAMRMCKECGATFVIDGHVELVKELGADGVHLGKNDMPIKEARSLLGEGFIIGGTANTFADVKAHYEAGADYIGCGPFRFTTTKENLSPVLGLEGYEQILRRMKDEGIDLPVVAIGGITINDIPQLMRIGMSGVALSGTVLRAADPVAEMRQIVSMAALVEKKE